MPNKAIRFLADLGLGVNDLWRMSAWGATTHDRDPPRRVDRRSKAGLGE